MSKHINRRYFLKQTAAGAGLIILSGSARAAFAQLASRPAPQSAVVAIVQGTDLDRMVSEAMDRCGGSDLIAEGKRVVVKPNLTLLRGRTRWFAGRTYPGQTTDVRVVESLIKHVRSKAKPDITIAEGAGQPVGEVYEAAGYEALSAKHDVPLVDLEQAPRLHVRCPRPRARFYAHDMPVVTQKADVLIDMPMLKTHNLTGLTCGLKNLFGLLPQPREVFHPKLDEVIVDLHRMRKPDLVVVDGTTGMEGNGPIRGEAVKMNLVIAGTDVVAVDTVACAIMNLDAGKILHLQMAGRAGLGVHDLNKITILGEPIESVRRAFKPARPGDALPAPGIQAAAQPAT